MDNSLIQTILSYVPVVVSVVVMIVSIFVYSKKVKNIVDSNKDNSEALKKALKDEISTNSKLKSDLEELKKNFADFKKDTGAQIIATLEQNSTLKVCVTKYENIEKELVVIKKQIAEMLRRK